VVGRRGDSDHMGERPLTRRVYDANGQFAAGVTFAGRLAHEGRAMLWTVERAGAQLSPDVVAPGEDPAAGVQRRAVHVGGEDRGDAGEAAMAAGVLDLHRCVVR